MLDGTAQILRFAQIDTRKWGKLFRERSYGLLLRDLDGGNGVYSLARLSPVLDDSQVRGGSKLIPCSIRLTGCIDIAISVRQNPYYWSMGRSSLQRFDFPIVYCFMN